MAKGFHYFKFIATEWLTGDIVFEDFELQGIFINICAIYWHRNGVLSLDEIEKRLKSGRLNSLSGRFFLVSDGFISIKFLDEQLIEAGHISTINSANGKLGGRPKAKPTKGNKATAKRPQSDRKANESQIELEIDLELKENIIKTAVETSFQNWIGMRKKMKGGITEHAIELGKKELEKLAGGDSEMTEAIINQSILNSWKGFFPIKNNQNGKHSRKGHDIEGIANAAREVLRKHNLEKYGTSD